MKRNKEQPTIRHAVALGCGIEPQYEGDKIVDWHATGETNDRARALGAFIKAHPKQFGSKNEPSIIAVTGGYPGVALPNNPIPPRDMREGIFMRDLLWEEFGVEANVVEIGSTDTVTNGSHVSRMALADERFRDLHFSPENAVGLGTSYDHFWGARMIFERALLEPGTDRSAIQLIEAPNGGGAKRVAMNAARVILLRGMFDQLGTEYRNPDSLDAAAEAFTYVTRGASRAELGKAMLLGAGAPMSEQPFVRVAHDYLALPDSPEANAQFMAQISAPTQP